MISHHLVLGLGLVIGLKLGLVLGLGLGLLLGLGLGLGSGLVFVPAYIHTSFFSGLKFIRNDPFPNNPRIFRLKLICYFFEIS